MSIMLTLVLLAALFVANDLLRPKPRVEDARPQQLSFPTSTKGRPVPLVWGTVRLRSPNTLWYGDSRQEAITARVKTSSIFNSGKRYVTGFRYYVGIQLGLCRGDANTKLKEWRIGEKVVWSGTLTDGQFVDVDLPEFFGGETNGSGGLRGRLRFHAGTTTQAVNSYLTAHQTVGGVTPRYTGTCYVVWEGGYIGTSNRIDAWDFQVERIPNPLGLGSGGAVNTSDASPMNVAYELFTANTEWGYRYAAGDIDVGNWTTAASTLTSEGSGMSMALEQFVEGDHLLDEIQRQVDGIFFLDHRSGKWKVKLARADYDVLTVPHITDDNRKEVRDFSRGTWVETTNTVRVKFDNRADDYATDYAQAIDTANALMQGGGTLSTLVQTVAEEYYPGVKHAPLANSIAWRTLRVLSYPLAKAQIVVNREFWDVTPYSVVAWTDAKRGISRLPMRVQRINYGELAQNRIVLDLVQDVFTFAAGGYGDPPGSGWDPPSHNVTAFASNDQFAMPAPRGITTRDDAPALLPRVWTGGRQSGAASYYEIRERHAPGTPTGAFTTAGEAYAFLLIGQLKNNLAAGTAVPTSSIVVEATPSSQAAIVAAFEQNPEIGDQGRNLVNLIMVGEELMLVRSASISGADVALTDAYRGALDSGQRKHLAGTRVYLVSVGTGLTDSVFTETHNVDVKLLPRSYAAAVSEGSATTIQFNMDKRLRRPYPPASATTNGGSTVFPSTNSLDHLASGAPETTGMRLTILRRDYRTGDGFNDEIQALTTDAATLRTDFPTAHNTRHRVAVRNNPDGTGFGSNVLLFTTTAVAGRDHDILRLLVLRYTDGAVPTRMRFEVTALHDEGGDTDLTSRYPMTYDCDVTSAALSGKFNFGARANGVTSNTYTATQAGSYGLTLSSAFSSGDVEYRLNAGAWTVAIAAGNTTGTIAGVAASDTIELRHTSSASGALKQLDVDAPSTGQDGYMVLYV